MADSFFRILFVALYNFPVVPQPTEHTHPPQDQGVVTEAGRTVENFILSKGEVVTGLFFCAIRWSGDRRACTTINRAFTNISYMQI